MEKIIEIPEGYEARIEGNKVVLEPKESKEEREYVRTIKSLISDFLRGKDEIDRGYYQKIYDWLDGRLVEEKPAEWSEEDEKMRNVAIDFVKQNNSFDFILGIDKDFVIDWLKSLRPRLCWKPSEEQMEALEHSLGDYNIVIFRERHELLSSLYHDLKKLM